MRNEFVAKFRAEVGKGAGYTAISAKKSLAARVLVLLAGCSVAATATAQSLQAGKPIRLVLPYAAASQTDLATRPLAEALTPLLGSPVIVDLKPGATGKIAAEAVARSDPDGHTLLVGGTPQLVMLPILDKSLSYKAFDDFRMVSIWAKYDIIFMTGGPSGVKSMRDLVGRMQAKPSDVTFAAVGQAQLTPTGLAGLVLMKMVNGNAQEVNYPGGAPAVIDLIAGRVTFTTNTLAGNLARIQSGQIVALAVATPKRLAQLPDVPTMAEAGFPEFMSANNWSSWIATAAPRKTPDGIVNTVNRAMVQALQSETLRARIEQLGLTVLGTGTATEDGNSWRAEHDRLDATLKRLDIHLP